VIYLITHFIENNICVCIRFFFIFSFTKKQTYDSSLQSVQSHSKLFTSESIHKATEVNYKRPLMDDTDSMSASSVEVNYILFGLSRFVFNIFSSD